MNIFVLDTNINKCAKYHCDQHVNKMILESVQIMCTALNTKGFNVPYKPTHVMHPCVRWIEKSYDNFIWLRNLALALNDEYKFRYTKVENHRSISVLSKIMHQKFDSVGLTEFAQAMPDEYKIPGDAVKAYRNFYLGEKMSFAKWTRRRIPIWVKQAS